MLVTDVVRDLGDRGLHAVRERLTSDDDHVGLGQHADEVGVQGRGGILRVRNLGHHAAVVLGPGVASLGDVIGHGEVLALPTLQGLGEIGVDVVPPGADQAVGRPHEQRVVALALQRARVLQGAGAEAGVAGGPDPVLDVVGGDEGERRGRVALGVHPPGRVRDVDEAVRVEGHVDVLELATDTIEHGGQALHVVIGTGNRKGCTSDVAEVVLGIDDERVNVERHGILLLLFCKERLSCV